MPVTTLLLDHTSIEALCTVIGENRPKCPSHPTGGIFKWVIDSSKDRDRMLSPVKPSYTHLATVSPRK